jgi:hypothetical protein
MSERVWRRLNDAFADRLRDAMDNEFGIEVETTFDLLGSMQHVTFRTDGKDFEPKERAFMAAFETGYLAAMALAKGER